MRYAAPTAIHPGAFATQPDGLPLPIPFRERARLDSLRSVDIVITPNKDLWTKVVVLEMCEDPTLSQGGRRRNHLRAAASVDKNGVVDANETREGFGWFPGYAINIETGQRLNMAFGEDSRLSITNGRDMIWNPDTVLFGDQLAGQPQIVMGGKHFIYVFGSAYDQGERNYQVLTRTLGGGNPSPNNLPINVIRDFYGDVMYTSIPLRRAGRKLLDNAYTAKIRMGTRYRNFVVPGTTVENNGRPLYEIDATSLAPIRNDMATAKSALDLIRVVPNPYYAASRYETSQVDNRVKFTNLPQRCDIRIYTLGGSLVRTLRKDDPFTFVDWDLLNQERIPVASGAYIIHINAPGIGEKVVKWFGVMRPIDLDTF
jgi:hypothetical protein